MYNIKGFNEHCHVVETGEWTEEFSEKFELVYEKQRNMISMSGLTVTKTRGVLVLVM